jgi:transcriptional regulator with XRE-family HTH domain
MTQSKSQRLGKTVRTAREAQGLSTHALAELVGVQQSRIVRLEQGKILEPQPKLLHALSQALDLRLVDLYELAGIRMPGLQPYLRAQLGFSDRDTARVQAYIEKLAAKYGADGSGPHDGADEQPEQR